MPRDPPCRLGLLSADEADTLAGGFDDVYALLLRHQARAIRGGVMPTTYLDPRDLDTLTRRHLRESFRRHYHGPDAGRPGLDEQARPMTPVR
jgi:hypothetical protein